MLVEIFDEHCDFGLYTPKYHPLDQIVEDIQRLGTLFLLRSGSYNHDIVCIKQAYNRTLQRGLKRMMERVSVMRSRYENELSHEMKNDNEKLRWCYERLEGVELSGSYVVREEITITMDNMARATDMNVRKSLTVSFATGLAKIFKVSTINTFQAHVRKVAAEQGKKVPDAEVRLTFAKSGYLMGNMFRLCGMFIWITD